MTQAAASSGAGVRQTGAQQAGAEAARAEASEASTQRLQQLVDRAASFDLHAVPGPLESPGARGAGGAGGAPTGFRQRLRLHRLRLELAPVSADDGVRAHNRTAEAVGELDLDWTVVPWDFFASPLRRPPAIPLDPTRTQRFAMQGGTFRFGGGEDGFHSFGTGRTFPLAVAGRPRLVAAAIGIFTGGFGRAAGLEGNFTVCGELSAERGFTGHVMVRIVDPEGRLRATGPLPPPAAGADPEPDVTYLTWVARKAHGAEWENYFSLTPEGTPRGLNIPVELRRVEADAAVASPGPLAVPALAAGGVVGKEIGFGREVNPRTGRNGNATTPFQFEGVSQYLFRDPGGAEVGSLTANFMEGRSVQMRLAGAPEMPALRFGYFGAVVGGTGCFAGAQGMIYGTAGSVFAPPPFEHVITNLYVARLQDPGGAHRAGGGGGGR